MKIRIDVVAGFIDSGKTSLSNQIIKYYLETYKESKILLIQAEKGQSSIQEKLLQSPNLMVEALVAEDLLSASKLLSLVEAQNPDAILIEYNGMQELDKLLTVLETPQLRKKAALNRIISTVDAVSFENYLQNLGSILVEPLSLSDAIVLTKTSNMTLAQVKQVRKKIKSVNKDAEMYEVNSPQSWEKFSVGEFLSYETKSTTTALDDVASFALLYSILIGCGIILVMVALDLSAVDTYISRTLAFTTIFISILLQAFPFLLAGTLVSAFIQVFIPERIFTRFFPKHPLAGMAIGLIGGVFFPICDCAIIPVMRRLLQKGVPLSAAICFLLAAPIVDPIVILSTLYAFPETPRIAIMRVVLGLLIAIIIGSIFLVYKPKNYFKNMHSISSCQCGFCNIGEDSERTTFEKVKAVLIHSGTEFFQVGQFLVIAAAFSTFMQTSISRETIMLFSGNEAISLITMMGFAFILSICSTSDAFIARNFIFQFPLESVMGFMVFGAMMDIKNLFLLSGSFKRDFVVKLVGLIVIVSFIILYSFSNFFAGSWL